MNLTNKHARIYEGFVNDKVCHDSYTSHDPHGQRQQA